MWQGRDMAKEDKGPEPGEGNKEQDEQATSTALCDASVIKNPEEDEDKEVEDEETSKD